MNDFISKSIDEVDVLCNDITVTSLTKYTKLNPNQRSGQAIAAPTDHRGYHDRARQQPDASERVDQVDAETTIQLGRPLDHAPCELREQPLHEPRHSADHAAERRRAEDERSWRCERNK